MKRAIAGILLLVCLAACTRAAADPLGPVEGYLEENIGQTAYGGKVFCAYEVLGMAGHADQTDVYVWALCGEYYLAGGELTLGTASSLPVALHLQYTDGRYQEVGYEIPGDGNAYMPSIQRIFPADAIRKMCHEDAACYNARAARLQQAILVNAREYYGVK